MTSFVELYLGCNPGDLGAPGFGSLETPGASGTNSSSERRYSQAASNRQAYNVLSAIMRIKLYNSITETCLATLGSVIRPRRWWEILFRSLESDIYKPFSVPTSIIGIPERLKLVVQVIATEGWGDSGPIS